MFENLDQEKGQNLTGRTPSSAPASASMARNVPPMPKAPVEDMFAGVKDISPARKVPGAAAGMPKLPQEKKISSGNGLRTAVIVVIVLVIVILGILIAGRFTGVEIMKPSSWASKISDLSGSLFKKSGETVIINNTIPAPETNQNNPAAQPATPAVTTPANPETPVTASATPAVVPAPAASSTPDIATSSPTLTLDSDNDGLTDYQEINIYHTNPHNPDTDGDGYLDGAEVKAGYNPLGPGKLQ
jgi:hypothetical protein